MALPGGLQGAPHSGQVGYPAPHGAPAQPAANPFTTQQYQQAQQQQQQQQRAPAHKPPQPPQKVTKPKGPRKKAQDAGMAPTGTQPSSLPGSAPAKLLPRPEKRAPPKKVCFTTLRPWSLMHSQVTTHFGPYSFLLHLTCIVLDFSYPNDNVAEPSLGSACAGSAPCSAGYLGVATRCGVAPLITSQSQKLSLYLYSRRLPCLFCRLSLILSAFFLYLSIRMFALLSLPRAAQLPSNPAQLPSPLSCVRAHQQRQLLPPVQHRSRLSRHAESPRWI